MLLHPPPKCYDYRGVLPVTSSVSLAFWLWANIISLLSFSLSVAWKRQIACGVQSLQKGFCSGWWVTPHWVWRATRAAHRHACTANVGVTGSSVETAHPDSPLPFFRFWFLFLCGFPNCVTLSVTSRNWSRQCLPFRLPPHLVGLPSSDLELGKWVETHAG